MKKIVVSTFNNSKNNYGALFQACSLYRFLTSLGYEVNYTTIQNRRVDHVPFVNRIKQLIKKIIQLPHIFEFRRRTDLFVEFASKTQNQVIYLDENELYANPPIADIYLSGSDQVWNPVKINPDLFLDYAPQNAKRISYAASMGNETIPVGNMERVKKYISQYDSISVREDTLIPIISEMTTKEVNQHVDPVFLTSQEQWRALAEPYKRLKFDKYILAYIIEWDSQFNRKLQTLKNELKLPVVWICMGNIKNVCADQIIYDASPSHFLYLLDHADTVVATSFHGIAMSVIFNKRFVAFVGQDKPTRIESLLRHFQIQKETTDSIAYGPTDYQLVNEIIETDKAVAKKYLQTIIEKDDH